ncbi:FAD/NAD(P)-binding protein [Neorhizobium sp. NCHU2750]|uniref:FAD/NAD(P)-binding protein n=1 Tax=Neorhizobium sp. NCHU2750 TaxID=1825976 RepID=UPI000E72D42F|nr:FAD-dependent pyridine nucleotide-disulfide oxidoreductase [Neorhizobium sp. NCHU2750]
MIYDVAVVGSGFSAIALTINLLRGLKSGQSIAIVGDDPGFGRGTAYRSEFHLHRLNVAAARMSVFPDEPADFVDWLTEKGRNPEGNYFASRGDYGLYLRDRLAVLLRQRGERPLVDFIKAKATACMMPGETTVEFHLDNGSVLEARNVALCLGVGNADMPISSKLIPASLQDRVVQNPWRLGWLSSIGARDEVCILGSGLTMIDQVLSLRAHGHRGRIHVLSRRGLVPHGHTTAHAAPVEPRLPEKSREISDILATFRAQVRDGADWRALMDGLRPRTQALWQELNEAQRARFMRHALAWWNIHRHRLAPQVAARFQPLIDDGTVVVHAGFIREVEDVSGRIGIRYRKRGTSDIKDVTVDWIVNCTGMERAGIAHSPLLQQMREASVIGMDRLGLGMSVDRHSRLCCPEGNVRPGLYAVGALTAGQFWEITAVPNIRDQAKQVAMEIAERLETRGEAAYRQSA